MNSHLIQHTFMPSLEMVGPGGGLSMLLSPRPNGEMPAEASLAGGDGGIQLRPDNGGASSSAGGRAAAAWRLFHCDGFKILLFIFVLFVFGLFIFVNVWPLNRRFHSNRPVKFGLFLLKILCHFSRASCSHFSLNCPFKNDICMCVLYFIHTPPPQLLGLKLGLFLITGAVI